MTLYMTNCDARCATVLRLDSDSQLASFVSVSLSFPSSSERLFSLKTPTLYRLRPTKNRNKIVLISSVIANLKVDFKNHSISRRVVAVNFRCILRWRHLFLFWFLFLLFLLLFVVVTVFGIDGGRYLLSRQSCCFLRDEIQENGSQH